MCAADIHGNFKGFRAVLRLFGSISADYLIFNGDLIGGYQGYQDDSIKILKEMIALRANKQDSPFIWLMGNHEMYQIYNLAYKRRGYRDFVTDLRVQMGECRGAYIDFLKRMPFAAITKGGVMLIHNLDISLKASDFISLFSLDHEKIISEFNIFLTKMRGKKLINSSDNESQLDLRTIFRSFSYGKLLWRVFCSKDGLSRGAKKLKRFLSLFNRDFSNNFRKNLRVRISVVGHMPVMRGYRILNKYCLRFSSGVGVCSRAYKRALFIDAEKTYHTAKQLSYELVNLY